MILELIILFCIFPENLEKREYPPDMGKPRYFN